MDLCKFGKTFMKRLILATLPMLFTLTATHTQDTLPFSGKSYYNWYFGVYAGMSDGIIARLNEDILFYSKQVPFLVGNSPKQELGINIYPNPVASTINIINSTGSDIQEITIYSPTGKMILHISESIESIDVSEFSSGVYFIEFQFEEMRKVVNFIKH